jgi:hypothetical protein
MAIADFSNVSAALATIFEDMVVDQFNRSVVLTKLLPFAEAEGKNIVWDANFGTTPGTSVLADGATVVTFNNDSLVPATLNFGTYSEAFSVSGKALAAAARANNPDMLADLFAEKMDNAVTRLAFNINKDFFSGSGATDTIMGLTASGGGLKATGTYAGIDRSVQTQWAGNELLAGGVARPLSFQLMRDVRKAIYVASGMMPDLIVCDPTQHENYGMLFGSNRRYVQDISLRGNSVKLDGGYKALEFDGIPVIADPTCPAGQMLFLNTKYVKIRQLPNVSAPESRGGMIRLHGTAEEQLGSGETGLVARINPLAVNGDAYPFQLVLYPQIQVQRPNSCAILGDLQ